MNRMSRNRTPSRYGCRWLARTARKPEARLGAATPGADGHVVTLGERHERAPDQAHGLIVMVIEWLETQNDGLVVQWL